MRRHRGVALITALMVIALAAIVAAAMLSSSNLAIHRASTLSDTERAWWYADGIEAWVKSILLIDAQNSKTDDLSEAWAKPVDYLPVDEGSLRGGIIDLQGRFNLNNLSVGQDPNSPELQKYKAQFQLLVANIDALKEVPTDGLADAIRDWIDGDDNPSSFGGAEDSEYTTLQPPYRAANRLMTSVSELLAIKGVTKEIYVALRPYVCALPKVTPINVNTAPLPVLMSLGTGSLQGVEQFVQSRVEKPLTQAADFWTQTGLTQSGVKIDVVTEYFLLQGEAFIGSSHLALYSVIHRPKAGSGGLPQVISRSQDLD